MIALVEWESIVAKAGESALPKRQRKQQLNPHLPQLSKFLIQRLAAVQLTAHQFIQRSRLGQGTIYDILNRRHEPSRRTLRILAEELSALPGADPVTVTDLENLIADPERETLQSSYMYNELLLIDLHRLLQSLQHTLAEIQRALPYPSSEEATAKTLLASKNGHGKFVPSCIGSLILYAMEQRNLSRAEFAQRSGIDSERLEQLIGSCAEPHWPEEYTQLAAVLHRETGVPWSTQELKNWWDSVNCQRPKPLG